MDAPDEAPDGTPLVDDDFLVLVNSWWEAVSFVVPEARAASREWRAELDSYDPAATAGAPARVVGDQVMVRPRASRRAGAT